MFKYKKEKKVLIYVFSLFFIPIFSTQLTFAQADICNTSPEYIKCLTNLVNWVISKIKIKKKKEEKSSLKNDVENFSKTLTDTAVKTVRWCFKFYSNSILQNVNQVTLWIFSILKSPEPVIRDYEMLWELWDLIENRFFNLCEKWLIDKPIPEDAIKNLKNFFENYNSCNWILKIEKINIEPSTTRLDVFEFLNRLVNIHKEILTQITRWSLSENNLNFKLSKLYYCQPVWWTNNTPRWCKYFDYEIDLQSLWFLKKQYTQCPFKKVNFFEEVNKLVTSFKNKISEDFDRIEKSYARLKETLSNLWWWLTEYEAELASKYWNKPFSAKMWGINPLALKRILFKSQQDLSKEWDEFKAPFVGFGKFLEAVGGALVDIFWKEKEIEEKYFQSVEQVKWKEEFVKTIVSTYKLMNENLNNLYVQQIQFDPTPITRMMPKITFEIKQATYLIWRKENEWSITWFLWKACENQCSNVWGICWYY